MNVVVQSMEPFPVEIHKVQSKGSSHPDGLYVGHVMTKNFLLAKFNNHATKLVLKPYEVYSILSHKGRPNDVMTGMIEMSMATTVSLLIKVKVIDPHYKQLSELNDPLGRSGVFPMKDVDWNVYFNCSDVTKEIPIGSSPVLYDSSENFTLQGNYGLLYRLKTTFINDTLRFQKINLYCSPVGGMGRGLFYINGQLIQTRFMGVQQGFRPHKLYDIYLKPHQSTSFDIYTIPQPGAYYPMNLVFQSEDH